VQGGGLCVGDGEGFQRLARGKIERRTRKRSGLEGCENGKDGGSWRNEAREDYKQGGRLEKDTDEREKRARADGRGSIHSNSVVKATACPTARRYLWGGFWVASVAANVTADRVPPPPPPRCPLFRCSSSPYLRAPLRRSIRPIRQRDSTFSEEKSIFQTIPLRASSRSDK